MFWIEFVSRIVHVSTAIVLIGGSVFTLFVMLPALSAVSDEARRSFADAVTGKWKRFVHIGILLFLVTGLFNYLRADHAGDGLYHALLGIKMLTALVVFFIASALVGRSKGLEAMRQNRRKWLQVLVLLAAVIVGISGYVKVRGIPAKAESPPRLDTTLGETESYF